MNGQRARQLRKAAHKAARLAMEQTPAWQFVAKIIRPKPRYLPMFLWRLLMRWLFPGRLDSKDS
jgi:hypothetical protein